MNTTFRPLANTYTTARRKPLSLVDWLMGGYIVCLPIQIAIGGNHLAPSDLFLVAILACLALGTAHVDYVRPAWSIWHVGLVLSFCMAAIVALVRTGNVTEYALINKLIGLIVLFAGYAVVVGRATSWQSIRWMLRLLIASVAIQNAVFVGAFMLLRATGIAIPGVNVEEPRLVGLLIDPNAYGGLLVVALSVHMITHYGRDPLIGGLLGKLVTISLAMGILLTYSRSAWIGLAMVFLIVIIFTPRTAVNLAVISALATAGIIAALGPGYMADMGQLSSRGTHESRIEIISEAIPMFWESPALGIGMGAFEDKNGVIIHNTPVWILTECGIIGFTIFAGFTLWFLQRGASAYRMADKSQKPLIMGLVMAGIAMMGLSLGIEALYQRHLWLVWALIAASYSVLARSRAQIRPVSPHQERHETCV